MLSARTFGYPESASLPAGYEVTNKEELVGTTDAMGHGIGTGVRRGVNLVKQQVLKRVKLRQGAGRVSEPRLDNLIEDHGNGQTEVFVHVGLSDVKAAFDVDPYAFLLEKLDHQFDSVIAPGFTDYFKTSGVYHKQHSRPKHGTFGGLFLEDADYRTDDAIKSFLVRGPYRFQDCVHHDSYHEDGCFNKLVSDNVLVMDIGTPWLTCSHLHYFESVFDVEYVVERSFQGVLLDDGDCRPIEQTCHQYESAFYMWNKPKIERLLEQRGVLWRYDLNGLQVLFFRLGDLADVIGEKLQSDEYYLVTV